MYSYLCFSITLFCLLENDDIEVTCNPEYMELSIFICPIYQSLYDENNMALNGEFGKEVCRGIPDWDADPPVLRFRVSMNESEESYCNCYTEVITEIGTGLFSDFSNVQYVKVMGSIASHDPSAGVITYRKQIKYQFLCQFPLQYLVNHTELAVYAVNENNGSFISTLNMALYSDESYTNPLVVPTSGITLKTRIFVMVRATNLTERFNVLLDRCFATTTDSPTNNTFYDLFVGCIKDGQTVVGSNGFEQTAFFSFEAFRFVEHNNDTVSRFFLHCVTRLCEVDNCPNLVPNCDEESRSDTRSGGDTTDDPPQDSVDELPPAVVSSPVILVSQFTSESQSTVVQYKNISRRHSVWTTKNKTS
uniref:Si:dkey-4p15.5 n=1 Tax=Gadus morhua TaxID=8049 RepID=A0A8C4ZAY9_GADMO